MTPLALTFMILSWSFVLGLTGWCFARVLRSERASAVEPRDQTGGHAGGGSTPGGFP